MYNTIECINIIPEERDSPFEHPKHMFQLIVKETNTISRSKLLICLSAPV